MNDEQIALTAWLGRDQAKADELTAGLDYEFINLDEDVTAVLSRNEYSAIVIHFQAAAEADLILTARLLTAWKDAPLIGLIDGTDQPVDDLIALGLDDYLFPPLTKAELKIRIRTALVRRNRCTEAFDSMRLLDTLEATYCLPTRRRLIAPMVDMLSGLVRGRLQAAGADLFNTRLTLSEVLTNAMEHGSLDITFDEKIEALERGFFDELIEKRMADPELSGRKIEVKVQIGTDKVVFTVSDQGSGFDVAAITERIRKTDPEAPCGRGLFLLEHYMDEYRYEDGGRRIVLTKHL